MLNLSHSPTGYPFDYCFWKISQFWGNHFCNRPRICLVIIPPTSTIDSNKCVIICIFFGPKPFLGFERSSGNSWINDCVLGLKTIIYIYYYDYIFIYPVWYFTLQSKVVADDFFHTTLSQKNRGLRKILLLVLTRARKPMLLQAFGLLPLSSDSFGQVRMKNVDKVTFNWNITIH